MSWTVVIVAAALLGQIPASAPGQPASAPLEEGVYGSAPAAQAPFGMLQGGVDRWGGQAPHPAASGTEAPPFSASGPLGDPPLPSQYGVQPAEQTPAPRGSATGADPRSNLPNPVQRLLNATDPKSRAAGADGSQQGTSEWYPSEQGAAPMGPASGFLPARRLSVQEMLDEAMTLPPGAELNGRRMSLLDVLGNVTDRAKRERIAHAYWRLAQALGEFRFLWDQAEQFQGIGAGSGEDALLRAVQERSLTELSAAELSVVEAQHSLAEAAGLAPGAELPIPSDRPHIGTYTTYFEQIFANRTPPADARLLNRTLPLQFQAIGVRTEAVHAAEGALELFVQAYRSGQIDASELFAAVRDVTDQRRAWIASVCRYNHAIADYALAVVGPETVGLELVSVLIKLSQAETSPANLDTGTVFQPYTPGVERAEYASPLEPGPAPAARLPGQPTLAPPREQLSEAPASPWRTPAATDGDGEGVVWTAAEEPIGVDDEPRETPATTEASPNLAEDAAEGPVSENASNSADDGLSHPPMLELPESAPDTPVEQRPMVAVEEADPDSASHTALKPAAPQVHVVARQYESLEGVEATIQAKRLASELHAVDRSATLAGRPVDLAACLTGVPSQERRAVLEAYWRASLRLGEYRAHQQKTQMLDDLLGVLTAGNAGTSIAAARLQAARLAGDADLLEAEIRLLEGQLELARRCDRPLEGDWLLPETPPHAGPYRMRLESQVRDLAESWTMRRLAVTIPALGQSLPGRARAIIEADRRRVEAMAAWESRRTSFQRVLDAVEEQTRQTLAFVDTLAVYNQAIADYAMKVVPPAIAGEQLVATLVVVR